MAGGEQMFQYVFARKHRFFSGFSAKARESVFQTRGCRERKTPHCERFAKEMAKGRQNRTQSIGVSATAQMPLYSSRADCAVI